MAIRPIYISTKILEKPFIKEDISFTWIKGMSYKQKCLRRDELKNAINENHDINTWLEVSTKSDKDVGKNLSSLNLKITTINPNDGSSNIRTVEEIYQKSKIKVDDKIVGFKCGKTVFPNNPYGMYYDYIYMLALYQNKEYFEELKKYLIFTDIEFNPNKQLNTQARACAIFRTLLENDSLNILEDQEKFKTYYKKIQ